MTEEVSDSTGHMRGRGEKYMHATSGVCACLCAHVCTGAAHCYVLLVDEDVALSM